jgi:hypothetical protein
LLLPLRDLVMNCGGITLRSPRTLSVSAFASAIRIAKP